jgi:hypothetical protein
MAFRQSYEAVIGSVRGAVTGSEPVCVMLKYIVPTGVLVNDITEMGAIPHGCYVTDAAVYQNSLGTSCTIDVGIMSGVYAKNDAARTVGNEVYAALAVATAGTSVRPTKNLMAISPSESAQGVGIKFTGAAPTAGQSITLVLTCASK